MDAKYQGVDSTATESIWFEHIFTKSSFQCCEHWHRDKISKGPKNKKIVKIGKISVKLANINTIKIP